MRMRFLDGLAPVAWPSAPESDLVAVFARVMARDDALLPEEAALVAGAERSRLVAFASGRHAAHVALRELGVSRVAVPRRGRAPVWPPGVVGSITHSRSLAAAVVGRLCRHVGIGVDIEPQGRVTPRVGERVLTVGERNALPEAAWRTALFSAKESVFKAVNPIVGEYLALGDVEITFADDALGGFSANTTRRCESSETVAAGRGYWLRYSGHWLTLFLVTASRPARRRADAGPPRADRA